MCNPASGALDQIAIDYPGRVAAIEMHVSYGWPLYCEEAAQRMGFYPPTADPPFYWIPWLWYDGIKGGYEYETWGSKIVDRMNLPSPVTINMWGDYSSARGSGTVYAQFRNDSSATLDGRVYFVITEDSIYYPAPNGDLWHNHVARDYVPDPNGMAVSISPGDSVIVSQPFTIPQDWVASKCEIITWIQDTFMQVDSTIEIWQGGMITVSELGIDEETGAEIVMSKVSHVPNPCTNGTNFIFQLPQGIEYQIELFDVLGRRIMMLNGVASGTSESIRWDLRDYKSSLVGPGVYFYCFKSKVINTTGKIVVR